MNNITNLQTWLNDNRASIKNDMVKEYAYQLHYRLELERQERDLNLIFKDMFKESIAINEKQDKINAVHDDNTLDALQKDNMIRSIRGQLIGE